MRILISSMNFTPEEIGVGKYSGEMATWLANAGHEVRVIAAQPYYPFWKVFNGYSSYAYSKEVRSMDLLRGKDFKEGSLTIFRCPVWVPSRPLGIARLIHLLSFAISSLPTILLQYKWRPQIVIAIEPPLLCAPLALILSNLISSRSVLHIHDYEIDAAFNLGLLKGKFIYDLALKFELYLMNRFDLVTSISMKMLDKLKLKGLDGSAIRLFSNWVNLDLIKPISDNSDLVHAIKSDFGLPKDCIIALYSGNMGNKQGLEMLALAAYELQDENIFFVFCGEGSGRLELQFACKDLINVKFLPLQPLSKFTQLLNIADIHLLPQRDEVADFVMPSKLMGILATGRPVVATARQNTEVGMIIKSCGLLVTPGDSFSAAIKKLACDQSMRESLGQNARRYAEDYFSYENIMRKFEYDLKNLVDNLR